MPNQGVIITGGSRGLGAAIAIAVAKAGYAVGINYQQRREAAENVCAQCREHGVIAEVFEGDVVDYATVQRIMQAADERLQGLYGIIANAGIFPGFGLIQDISPEAWRRTIDVNIHGVYNTFHTGAPYLVRRGAGRMIALSSLATQNCNPGFGPYTVSKVAVEGMVKVMGKELAPHGVRVNGIAPGLFDTEMGREVIDRLGEEAVKRSIPVQRLGKPEEIGALAVYLLSPESDFITAEIVSIHGGGRGVPLPPGSTRT